MSNTTKTCLKCGIELNLQCFSPRAKGKLGVNSRCKICCSTEQMQRYHSDTELYKTRARGYRKNNIEVYREIGRKYKESHPERKLLDGARYRAKKKNLECNLNTCDISIPEFCPILGIKLQFSKGKISDNSPSVDRIDCAKGYTKDNIHIISYKANRIKGHLTIAEVEKLLTYMKQDER